MSFVDLANPSVVRDSPELRRVAVLIVAVVVSAAISNLPVLVADDDTGERQSNSDQDRQRKAGEPDRRTASDQLRRERAPGEARDFRPQNEREALLLRMIQQLRREVESLKREIRVRDQGVPDRQRDSRRDAPREGEQPREGSRDRLASTTDAARRKAMRIFAAYDKNRDKQVVFDEWVAMKEGVVEGERLAREKQWFSQADRSGDERLSLEEFFAWMNRGRAASREGASRGSREEGPRRESDKPRGGDRSREGDKPRGDRPRETSDRE